MVAPKDAISNALDFPIPCVLPHTNAVLFSKFKFICFDFVGTKIPNEYGKREI
jgi:hypothetical protein